MVSPCCKLIRQAGMLGFWYRLSFWVFFSFTFLSKLRFLHILTREHHTCTDLVSDYSRWQRYCEWVEF